MKRKLREMLCPQPKSKIKAGDGKPAGAYNFYTSSQIQSKFYHYATYTQPALIFGTGGMASVHYCDQPFSTSTDCLVMYGYQGANIELICHYLRANPHILQAGFKGAGLQHISKDYILDIEIDMPDVSMQKKIITQMRLIDSLIDSRRKQTFYLDEVVKSQFIETFGNSSKYDSAPLNENVEEMFIGPFGSSLKNNCFVPKEESYCMVYEQKHAIKKTLDVETRYVDATKYRELQRFNVQGGDIIVSCRGTVGKIFLIPDNAPMGIMHPSIMKIRLTRKTYNRVFFTFLLEKYMDEHMLETNGTAVKMATSAKKLGKEIFPVPPMSAQEHFADIVQQADKSKLIIRQSVDKLETLKKALMQEYFG